MISPTRIRTIAQLGVPLMGVMLSQNLVGIIDMAMIGQFGNPALAGVGIASLLFSICVAFYNGLDSSVQANIARRVGEHRLRDAVTSLNSALLLSFAIGALLLIVAELLLPFYLKTVVRDYTAQILGEAYLEVRLPVLLFIGASYAFSAYWNATGRSVRSFYSVMVLLVCNATFNYILIFGKLGVEPMGVVGAALGSFFASIASLLVHTTFALYDNVRSTLFRELLTLRETISLLRAAMPVGVQQSFALIGFSLLMFVIGGIGVTEIAVANVLFIIVSLQALPVVGLGVASVTLVGQALGRGETTDAKQWGWETAQVGTFLMAVFSLSLLLFPKQVLGFFLASVETIEFAVIPLQILAVSICLDTFAKVLNFALRGAGAMGLAAAIPFSMQWFVSLPFAWLIGIGLGFGLEGIVVFLLLTAALEAVIVSVVWRRTSWQTAQV